MRCFGWMGGLGVRAWGLGCSLPVIPSTARDLLSAPPARSLAALGMTSEPGGHAGPDCCPNRAHPAPSPKEPTPKPPPHATHPPPPPPNPNPTNTNTYNTPPNPNPTQPHHQLYPSTKRHNHNSTTITTPPTNRAHRNTTRN